MLLIRGGEAMQRFWAKSKSAGTDEVSSAYSEQVRRDMNLPADPDAPWVKAQQHHDNLITRLDVQIYNLWRGMGVALVLAGVAVGTAGYAFSLPRVEPVFVSVDKLGRYEVLSVGANSAMVPIQNLVEREMKEFITNSRSVTSDYTQNNVMLTNAFSRLDGAAYNYVKNDLQSHKPNDVAEKKSIQVDIKIAFPITDGSQRNSWQVEWTETSRDLNGEQIGQPEMWKANIQYELRPGKTREDVASNPVGFHIPTMSWAKMN